MAIKKVLFLCHPEMDYLQYMIFDGLCRILGDENVITFPYNPTYYGEIADNYILDDGKRGFTAPNDSILPRKKIMKTEEEVKKEIDTFDFVISSVRSYAKRALDVLRPHISQPLAFLDGEDGDDIKWDVINRYRADYYFKREYIRGQQIKFAQTQIIPCPFAAIDNTKPIVNDTQKEYSVFLVHGYTHIMRETSTKLLLEMNPPNSYIWINTNYYNDGFNPYGNKEHFSKVSEELLKKYSRLKYSEYLKMIAKSKIGVSVRGWGRDTIRRWEIPMYETLLFTHDIGLEDPHPFEDGKTCVMFKNDFSDFKEKLQYYLENENERIKIAQAGKEHLYKYHTTEKRATYILETIK